MGLLLVFKLFVTKYLRFYTAIIFNLMHKVTKTSLTML